ncbi:hypothetical protein [Streptomyces venezuelae]|uniref:hypothetical protein n=1 Tax=Streptomyces venezuelae TaxID=54571 RepID=UPI0034282A64
MAGLTPRERAEHEAEEEAAYWAQMADDAREPYDPDEERSFEYALDAADEERWDAERDGYADGDGHLQLTDEEYEWAGAEEAF